MLKMIEFQIFIQWPNEPGQVAQKPAWTSEHERICNLLHYVINENIFDEIEYHTNASDVWTLLKSIFKLKEFGFLNDVL